mmetsp:Transcript_39582/g.46261  ORF Transcript_39582/g.46261 Transcript_39582/m.46261 type:complete len:81 (-) Transcript_39582:797-1039(-)
MVTNDDMPNRTFCRGGMTKPKHSGIHLNAKIPPTQMKTVKNAWLGDEVLSKVIGETQKLSKESGTPNWNSWRANLNIRSG